MTIPIDKDQIDNLKKIAELNEEAGDWAYSPLRDQDGVQTKVTPVVQSVLSRVGNVQLPPKK
jgi:hypothetical protein